MGTAQVGQAAAAGAAAGSAIPVVGTAVGGAAGAVIGFIQSITGGGTPDQMKGIWNVVPANLIRITGGSGKWTDTVTGQTLNDAQTDVRKGAVVASAIGAYNDSNNWWYDNVTRMHITGAEALSRWQVKFGASATFASAYAMNPNAFTVYGGNPANDPGPPTAPISTVPNSYPAPLSPASAPATNGGAAGVLASVAGAGQQPTTPTVTKPAGSAAQQPTAPAPATAAPWYSSPAVLIGGVLLLGGLVYVAARRR